MSVPLALYLHLPWCVRKCPYCDFNSHPAGGAAPRARYVDALCRDVAAEAARAGGRELSSIFLGGGTPSLFSGAEIGRVLDAVRRACTLAADVEITMEANPGTLERHDLAGYRRAGVNRLSLGAQSFDDASLARLGRIHASADTLAAFADARRAGFDNVNLDLMYALPGQTEAMAAADLERALALGPEHLSWYQLTLEPNTVFYSRPPRDLPDEDACADIEARGRRLLAAAGYRQYEVSAFARPGRACRHNLNYWTFGDYLAAGAGAHGKVTDADGGIWRYRKPNNPLTYMLRIEQGPAATGAERVHGEAGPAATGADRLHGGRRSAARGTATPVPTDNFAPQRLAAPDIAFEYLLNALRLPAGFDAAHFRERTGLPLAAVGGELEAAIRDGLVEQPAPGRFRPSERGLSYLNELQARFLPAAGRD